MISVSPIEMELLKVLGMGRLQFIHDIMVRSRTSALNGVLVCRRVR